MPTYHLRCNWCGAYDDHYMTFAEHDEFRADPTPCPLPDPNDIDETCIGVLEIVIQSPMFIKGMEAGYNPTTGAYVSSSSDFKSQLSAASDAASLRTGTPHNYQPIDPRDPVAAGVTEEGMDATYNAEVKAGIREAKKFL